jgi:asparagine synthase (glutamine-hydrolysing)
MPMCGIAGWIDWQRDLRLERKTLQAMAQNMQSRGPDAEGSWVSGRAGLVHRRLIVVDPVGGAQPMTLRWGDGEYTMVYNGELYNTEEVRRELKSRGHSFRSYSDTEVLLHAFVEWGPSCLKRLNGIFAFAVWDMTREQLFLARDRLGVKPLFFSSHPDALIFGSEIKALLSNPLVSREVDMAGLCELLMIGPARTPGVTPLRGISELKPGHFLLYTSRGLAIKRYWGLESYEHEDNLSTTIQQVNGLLADAVARQMVSDVPVCTLLSGGLDSSAITALAVKAMGGQGKAQLHSFSVDYKDNESNFTATLYQPDADTPWVKRVSEELGTVHHRVILDTPSLVDGLLHSLRANDYPGMTDIDSSLLLFCSEIKKSHTVALSGEAADEIFGGYPWFSRPEALDATTFPWALMNNERIRLLAPELVEAMQPRQYVQRRYQEALDEVPRLSGESRHDTRLREMAYLSITRFMPTLLDRKDRMSMACGLEVRVPFTDHRLVEYAWNIPWSMKQLHGREKGILREALRGVLPEDVLSRKKSPYPKTHNPDYLEATSRWLLNVLDERDSPLYQLLDVGTVQKIAESGGQGFGSVWFGQLMGAPQLFAYLALLDTWLREYRIRIVV